ncbi:hypothetical protein [Mucilaginibacter sp.]|uniref:hypothetical protein n=1 Tax=Mucilaginibacter sp. TaxID=1882438 RepID=UPI0035BBD8ED
MERFDIRIKKGKEELEFEVKEYLHHDGEKCKFEVFKDHELVVSFNPDPHENLSVCQNPGNLDKQLVHLIADKLEPYV